MEIEKIISSIEKNNTYIWKIKMIKSEPTVSLNIGIDNANALYQNANIYHHRNAASYGLCCGGGYIFDWDRDSATNNNKFPKFRISSRYFVMHLQNDLRINFKTFHPV